MIGDMGFMLVDTENGLKIVAVNSKNFFRSDYAVQMTGSKEACQAEKKRLEAYEQGECK